MTLTPEHINSETAKDKSRIARRSTYPGGVTEDAFRKFAADRGWKASKRGWPDFLCVSKTDEWFAVEVKPTVSGGSRFKLLKREQIIALDFLTFLGVRCYVSDGVRIEPYKEKHRRGYPQITPKIGLR